jgi:hypothetical protein
MTTIIGLFNKSLIGFFKDLYETFPEERDIKLALEAIEGARKINPKLIVDLFYENVYRPLHADILDENADKVISFARSKIAVEFNEISPAIMIFDKHWDTLSDQTRNAIWKHLKVLILLAEKAKA